ncbi:hypothetical protein RMCBS344292_04721 [Rhizopus microsporus]|nr:hypothetical protein RMCBS344292_04721 [Rhizopus microsporus]
MEITKEEAACSIYGLVVNQENKDIAIKNLESTELVPVYFANGDLNLPFVISKKKAQMEPWRYTEYRSELKPKEHYQNPAESSSLSSYEVTVPCSKRSILELLHLIIPPKPIPQITYEEFLTESELFKLVKQYFSDDWNFNQSKLNDLIGRTYNVVEASLRDFKWKDISNISQFRYLVRTTQPQYVTIGYVRKSNTTESTTAKQKSLSLQAYKLKTKALCKYVFSSVDTNADTLIHDRDYIKKKNTIKIKNSHGDCQDLLDFITMSDKKIRLVIISFPGLSTSPSDVYDFVKNHRNLKEIVVDMGYKVEIFTRHQLLHDDKILNQFECRTSVEKRSLL